MRPMVVCPSRCSPWQDFKVLAEGPDFRVKGSVTGLACALPADAATPCAAAAADAAANRIHITVKVYPHPNPPSL
jgi:hypothetical protein